MGYDYSALGYDAAKVKRMGLQNQINEDTQQGNLSVVLLTWRVFLKRIRVTPGAAGRCRRVARRCGPTPRFVAGPRREGGARSRKHRLAGSHPHDL